VIVNFTGEAKHVDLPGEWKVDVASDGAGEGEPFPGRVRADQAVVLRN
jgi:alpha-glucosidase